MKLKQIVFWAIFITAFTQASFFCKERLFLDNYAFESRKKEQDSSGIGFGTMVLTGCLAKIAYDISWHDRLHRSISEIYDAFISYIEMHDIKSLSDAALYDFFTRETLESIVMHESWMRDSYDSYIKFWNWNIGQKIAYEKIQLLSMVALHGPMIKLGDLTQSSDIITQARKYFFTISKYPLITYSEVIDTHISRLFNSLSFCVHPSVSCFLSELKKNIYSFRLLLYSDKEYSFEFYNFKLHNLLVFKNSNTL